MSQTRLTGLLSKDNWKTFSIGTAGGDMRIIKQSDKVIYFPPINNTTPEQGSRKGGNRTNKKVENLGRHPIDLRLKEIGKSRRWLAEQVQRTPQCVGNYCNRKIMIKPDSLLTRRICKTLGVDLNYLILGRSYFQAQDISLKK